MLMPRAYSQASVTLKGLACFVNDTFASGTTEQSIAATGEYLAELQS